MGRSCNSNWCPFLINFTTATLLIANSDGVWHTIKSWRNQQDKLIGIICGCPNMVTLLCEWMISINPSVLLTWDMYIVTIKTYQAVSHMETMLCGIICLILQQHSVFFFHTTPAYQPLLMAW